MATLPEADPRDTATSTPTQSDSPGTAAAPADSPSTATQTNSPATAAAPADSPSTAPKLPPEVWRALGHGHTIDITTRGRRTGQPRRIEMMFHSFGGRLYLSGIPNPNRVRSWLLNLRAEPRMTFHLKQFVEADLSATAREITDPAERRAVLEKIARVWRRDVEEMLAHSPLVEITIPGYGVADPEYRGESPG